MYLSQAIRDFEGDLYEMVGLFPAQAIMKRKTVTIGYRKIEMIRPCLLGSEGTVARGHEHHYSFLESSSSLNLVCAMKDAGTSRGQDGLVFQRVLGVYTHLHFGSQPSLA